MVGAGELIRNASRDTNGACEIEPASYDLRVGTILWKDRASNEIQRKIFDEKVDALRQEVVTVLPGQMVFVVTQEELVLPQSICATVYSRNTLQKRNILALNAGHVDPGYEGPIIIRLINLGAVGRPLSVGEAVFTVVFHTVEKDPHGKLHPRRTMEETVSAAAETALRAFSNPFFDLYESDIKRKLDDHYARVEGELRLKFSKEHFRRDEVYLLFAAAGAAAAGALATIAALSRIWGPVFGSMWHFLRSL
jgi:deoxycytidine triphosphate deaminase